MFEKNKQKQLINILKILRYHISNISITYDLSEDYYVYSIEHAMNCMYILSLVC